MTSFMAIFSCQILVFDVLCKLAKSLAQMACAQTFGIILCVLSSKFSYSQLRRYRYVILKRTIK